MDSSNLFRDIPAVAFADKPIIRIRDIDAVVYNYKLYRRYANESGTECAVVLKGNVHGLGMKDVAPALYAEGVRVFFIEELIEGIDLSQILKANDITIFAMAGLLPDEEEYFYRHNIAPCLNCLEQLQRWNNFCKSREPRECAIHLDSHMNRLGMLDDEVEFLGRNFGELTSHIRVKLIMSHLFDIKGDDHSNCYMQLEVLKNFLKQLPKLPVSFACTDGFILLNRDDFAFDQIRIGIGLVGGAPNARSFLDKDAKHCIEIYTKISQLKTVKKGRTIGYGGAYTVKRDTKMVLAHIGYKDGYLRSLSNIDSTPPNRVAYMNIGGYKAPVIGKISLGMTTLDVTDVPEEVLAKCKYAEVVGPNVDLRELADIVGCYEILVALGRPNPKVADYTMRDFVKLD